MAGHFDNLRQEVSALGTQVALGVELQAAQATAAAVPTATSTPAATATAAPTADATQVAATATAAAQADLREASRDLGLRALVDTQFAGVVLVGLLVLVTLALGGGQWLSR
jgi:hypothetical protein